MKLIRLTCALLIFSLLAAVVFSFSSVADEKDGYDFSYPSATVTEEISADEFLKEYVSGISLSDVEANYLREQSGFLFAFNKNIPTSYVDTSYENGVLTVRADEYKYVAENGVSVVWKPVSVTLYSEKKSLSASSYTATFSGVYANDKDSIKVEYKASFTIASEEVNRLINLAYNEAPKLKAEIEAKALEYEENFAKYQIDKADYNEYLAKLAVYETYEAALREYNAKYAEYQNYVKEWNEYKIAENKYNEYVIALKKYNRDLADYEKYLAYKAQNEEKALAYEKYQEKYAIVSAQLDIIKKTKTPVTDLNRTIYAAITGDTVSSVLNSKGDIVDVLKADPKIVDAAGEATEILIELLKGFFDIKNTQGQYEYYINNYEAFRDNFIKLLQTLDALYLVEGVKGALEVKEKEEKYVILLAQLYYVANALSDEPVKSYRGDYVYDETYQIGRSYKASERYYPCDVIKDSTYMPDTDNAIPLAEGYPQNPGTPDVLPVAKPTEPEYVQEPTAPTPVTAPTAPTMVEKPNPVKNPGKEPTPYVPTDAVLALVGAYERGELSERATYVSRDIVIEPQIYVDKVFCGAETVTVTYYDREYVDGESEKILYTVETDLGGYADYLGKTPTKDEDADYIYTHLFWVDAEGNTPDLENVTQNLSLYPTFSGIEKEYETYWELFGELLTENPGIPPLPEAEKHFYDFSGWERVVDPVTSNVIYRPIYDKPLATANAQTLGVTIDAAGNYVIENLAAKTVNIENLIARAEGSGGIIIKTSSGEEISFSYLEVKKLYEAGVSAVTISFSTQGGGTYEVSATDALGAKIVDSDISASLKVLCTEPKSDHFVLYYKDTVGNKYQTRNTYLNGTLSFTAQLSKTYLARTEYVLNLPELEGVKITANKTLAAAGETVYVSVSADPGIRVDYLYVTTKSGEEIRITNGSFAMPAYDLTVSARYTVLSYTVEFKSGGKTIVKHEFLKYGDTVAVPSAPIKVSDDKFSYTFTGWSPELTGDTVTVTGNTVYYAKYEATPIVRDKLDTNVTPWIVKAFSLGVFGVCFAVAVLPTSIMTIVMVSKRRRR